MPVKQPKSTTTEASTAATPTTTPADLTETSGETTNASVEGSEGSKGSEGSGSDSDAAAQERTWTPVEWNEEMDLLLARTTLQLHKKMISGPYTATQVAKILKADLLFKDYPTLDATKIVTRLKAIVREAKKEGIALEFPPFAAGQRQEVNAAAIVNGLQDLLG